MQETTHEQLFDKLIKDLTEMEKQYKQITEKAEYKKRYR
jgi:hypothetical protein